MCWNCSLVRFIWPYQVEQVNLLIVSGNWPHILVNQLHRFTVPLVHWSTSPPVPPAHWSTGANGPVAFDFEKYTVMWLLKMSMKYYPFQHIMCSGIFWITREDNQLATCGFHQSIENSGGHESIGKDNDFWILIPSLDRPEGPLLIFGSPSSLVCSVREL